MQKLKLLSWKKIPLLPMNETKEGMDNHNSQMKNKNKNNQQNKKRNASEKPIITEQDSSKQAKTKHCNETNDRTKVNNFEEYEDLFEQLPDNRKVEIEKLKKILTNNEALTFLMKKSILDECPVIYVLTDILLIMKNAEEKKEESPQKANNNYLSFLDNPNLFMGVMFFFGMILAVIYLIFRN